MGGLALPATDLSMAGWDLLMQGRQDLPKKRQYQKPRVQSVSITKHSHSFSGQPAFAAARLIRLTTSLPLGPEKDRGDIFTVGDQAGDQAGINC